MVDRSESMIDHAIAEGMETLLADIIRKYPVIYDKTIKQKNGAAYQKSCDLAWNKISDELNLELESCKSLWSGMKQKFIKHRKRLDNGEPVTSWPTYNILIKWLDKHVKKRKSRQDYIKQMKQIPKTSQMKMEMNEDDDGSGGGGGNGSIEPEDGDGDDDDDDDEEWTELMNDKKTMVQVKLKRKSNTSIASDTSNCSASKSYCSKASINRYEPKKKFNIEVVSDGGTTTVYENRDELYHETDRTALIKDAKIVVLEENRTKQSTPQIELIDVKETIKCSDTAESIHKIERLLSTFVQSLERCNAKCTATTDSNDAFGIYIASMIRELPAHKRIKVRFNILQYATELIASETNSIE